jgi:hypothetical protein
MRRILTGIAVAALAAVIPTMALAGNQEMADQIAQRLRNSGEMSGYKIGIKFHEGTAWLRGRVTSDEQMNTALKIAFQTPGVTRVVNELALNDATETKTADSNPLREKSVNKADQVPNTFRAAPASPVSAEEVQEMPQQVRVPQRARPMANNYTAMQQSVTRGPVAPNAGRPMPMYTAANAAGAAPARYDQPCMPNYAWPSYAAYPNYAAVTYPKQYSPTAWPYIGPFYPYPQVPLGWRKVTLEWDSGWWYLDFKDQPASCWHR